MGNKYASLFIIVSLLVSVFFHGNVVAQTVDVTGTADFTKAVIFGNYKLYAPLGSNNTWAKIVIRHLNNTDADILVISRNETKISTATGLSINVVSVRALADGTVVGADLIVKESGIPLPQPTPAPTPTNTSTPSPNQTNATLPVTLPQPTATVQNTTPLSTPTPRPTSCKEGYVYSEALRTCVREYKALDPTHLLQLSVNLELLKTKFGDLGETAKVISDYYKRKDVIDKANKWNDISNDFITLATDASNVQGYLRDNQDNLNDEILEKLRYIVIDLEGKISSLLSKIFSASS